MARLLYVKGSPRGMRSHSIAVADQFVEAYRVMDIDAEIMIHDVFRMDLPSMDGQTLTAKYNIMHGQGSTREEQVSWMKVEAVIKDFVEADKYVFAIPMWNFGIPYKMKQYLDVIIQPNYTFSFTPGRGYSGLVKGKKAFIAYASGGEYSPGTPGEDLDYCRNYMDLVLSFMGITDVDYLVVEPTLEKGPEEAAKRQEAAIDRARLLARDF